MLTQEYIKEDTMFRTYTNNSFSACGKKDPVHDETQTNLSEKHSSNMDMDEAVYHTLSISNGLYIEIGAGNGLNQSRTNYLEKNGWQGLLIEPSIEACGHCITNRPISVVLNYDCTGDFSADFDTMHHWDSPARPKNGLSRALASIIEELEITAIDLLVINARANIEKCLRNIDFTKVTPRFILLEEAGSNATLSLLEPAGYRSAEPMGGDRSVFQSYTLYQSDESRTNHLFSTSSMPSYAESIGQPAVYGKLSPEHVEILSSRISEIVTEEIKRFFEKLA